MSENTYKYITLGLGVVAVLIAVVQLWQTWG